MTILMTSIYVNDSIKAFSFYTEILGFEKLLFIPEQKLAIIVSHEQPKGTSLLLEPNDNPIAKNYQQALYSEGLPVIILGTEDINIEYDRLEKLGVIFKSRPISSEWGLDAFFEDTCGNWIQLHQQN